MKNSHNYSLISICLIVLQVMHLLLPAFSIAELNLPVPGARVLLSQTFSPVMIQGVNVHADNPFRFDFIIDEGDTSLSDQDLRFETEKLVKYFFASLTVPDDQMWVNLSPYEKNRVVPDIFGATEMGRDLLIQDYLLKQLTASLIYPENILGKEFWERVTLKSLKQFGTLDVPVNTFHKVWIVPERAKIVEHVQGAYIINSRFKVLLEEDYLALASNKDQAARGLQGIQSNDGKEMNQTTSQIMRDILIPEIEREVNEGETFANLRQIYHSLLLGKWYKDKLRSALDNQDLPLKNHYMDQGKIQGVNIEDPSINQDIYQQYIQAFDQGVFDYVKKDYDPGTKQIIPRQYFSGGVDATSLDYAMASKKEAKTYIPNFNVPVRVATADISPQGAPQEPTEQKYQDKVKIFTRKFIGSPLYPIDEKRILDYAQENAKPMAQNETSALSNKLILGQQSQTSEFQDTFPFFSTLFPLVTELLKDLSQIQSIYKRPTIDQAIPDFRGSRKRSINQVNIYEVENLEIPAISYITDQGVLHIYIQPANAIALFNQMIQSLLSMPPAIVVLLETAFSDEMLPPWIKEQMGAMTLIELKDFLLDYQTTQSRIRNSFRSIFYQNRVYSAQSYALAFAENLYNSALSFYARNGGDVENVISRPSQYSVSLKDSDSFVVSDSIQEITVDRTGNWMHSAGMFSEIEELSATVESTIGALADTNPIKSIVREIWEQALIGERLAQILDLTPQPGLVLVKKDFFSIQRSKDQSIHVNLSGQIRIEAHGSFRGLRPSEQNEVMGLIAQVVNIQPATREIWETNQKSREEIYRLFRTYPEFMPTVEVDGIYVAVLKENFSFDERYLIELNGNLYKITGRKELEVLEENDSQYPFMQLLDRIVETQPNLWMESYPTLALIWNQFKQQRAYMRKWGVTDAKDLPSIDQDNPDKIVLNVVEPSLRTRKIFEANTQTGLLWEHRFGVISPMLSIDEETLAPINALMELIVKDYDMEFYLKWTEIVVRRKKVWETTKRDPGLLPQWSYRGFDVYLSTNLSFRFDEDRISEGVQTASEEQMLHLVKILEDAQPFVQDGPKMLKFYKAAVDFRAKLRRFGLRSTKALPYVTDYGKKLVSPLPGNHELTLTIGGIFRKDGKEIESTELPAEDWEYLQRSLDIELEFQTAPRDESLIPKNFFRTAIMNQLRAQSRGIRDITRKPRLGYSLAWINEQDSPGGRALELPWGDRSGIYIYETGTIEGFDQESPEKIIEIIENLLAQAENFADFPYYDALEFWDAAKENFLLLRGNGFMNYRELPKIIFEDLPPEALPDSEVILQVQKVGFIGQKIFLNNEGKNLVHAFNYDSLGSINSQKEWKDLYEDQIEEIDRIMWRAGKVNRKLFQVWQKIRPAEGRKRPEGYRRPSHLLDISPDKKSPSMEQKNIINRIEVAFLTSNSKLTPGPTLKLNEELIKGGIDMNPGLATIEVEQSSGPFVLPRLAQPDASFKIDKGLDVALRYLSPPITVYQAVGLGGK